MDNFDPNNPHALFRQLLDQGDRVQRTLDQILEESKKTNGRVRSLEGFRTESTDDRNRLRDAVEMLTTAENQRRLAMAKIAGASAVIAALSSALVWLGTKLLGND